MKLKIIFSFFAFEEASSDFLSNATNDASISSSQSERREMVRSALETADVTVHFKSASDLKIRRRFPLELVKVKFLIFEVVTDVDL